MTMKSSLFAGLVAAIGATSTASATDEETKNFDGFFIGGELGTSFLEANGSGQGGFYYGALTGVRRQTDSGVVFGIEAALGNIDRSLYDGNSFGFVGPLNFKYQWSAAATFGHTFGAGGKNLIFGKIGYQKYKFRADLDDLFSFIENSPDGFAGVNPTFLASVKRPVVDDGFLLGIGYERSISNAVNFRVGVDYADGTNIHQWQPKLSVLFKF